MTRQEILQAALKLPEEERAKLLEEIAESLPAVDDEELVEVISESMAPPPRAD